MTNTCADQYLFKPIPSTFPRFSFAHVPRLNQISFAHADLLAMVSFIMTLLPKEEPDNEDETTDRAPESPMAPAPVPPPVPSTVPPAVPPPKTSTRRGSRALRQRKTPNEAQSFECPHCTKVRWVVSRPDSPFGPNKAADFFLFVQSDLFVRVMKTSWASMLLLTYPFI